MWKLKKCRKLAFALWTDSAAHEKNQAWLSFPHFLSKVTKNDKLGRYMVAARDLKAGEVLFREVAVVHGPKMLSHPICLGCHKALIPKSPKTGFYRCSSCSWPLCSKHCENLAPHVEECKLMASKHYKCPIKTNFSSLSDTVYWIFPLRFLLLKRSQPKMWGSFTDRDFHLVIVWMFWEFQF